MRPWPGELDGRGRHFYVIAFSATGRAPALPSVIRSVCVFCGARLGHDPEHVEEARRLGQGLAARGITLVYGGGRIGIMGAIADAVMSAGGTAIGVIPRILEEIEVGHTGLSTLEVADTMHLRKERMYALSDAFIVLPGGIGTLDETFEILTWRHLKLHDKPIVVLDHHGYWRPLAALLDHVVEGGFAGDEVRGYLQLADSAEAALALLERLGGTQQQA